MSAPYADNDVRIIITDYLVSKNYVDMTIDVMSKFGVGVERIRIENFVLSQARIIKVVNIL